MSKTTLTDKRQFVADTKKFFAQFPSFLKAAEIVEEALAAESGVADAQARLEAIREETRRISLEHEQAIFKRKADADQHIADKLSEAEKIEAAARQHEAEIVSKADEDLGEIRVAGERERARQQEELAKHTRALAELSKQHDELVDDIEARKHEHVAVTEALEKTRTEYNNFAKSVGLKAG